MQRDQLLPKLEALYTEHFGEITSVFHETETGGSHVDVYRFDSKAGRDFVTYISGGMSRQEQPKSNGDLLRVELLLYATKHDPLYPETIRRLCHYPWETGAAFLGLDLLPLGEHAKSVLGSNRFGGILVCPSTRREDHNLALSMRAQNPMVSPLNLLPLLNDEFEYAATVGVMELIDRILKSQHTVDLDHQRASVLSDTQPRGLDQAH